MVITVQCPSCATFFPVDPRKIPEKGVKVRCSSCAGVFRVERPAEEAPPPVAQTSTGAPPAIEAAPTPSMDEAPAREPPPVEEAPPVEPPPPAAPEPVMDEGPHFGGEGPEGPREETTTPEGAPEEPAAHWTAEYPPAEPEPWGASAPQAEEAPAEPDLEPGVKPEPVSGSPVDEWVVEREMEIDTGGLDIEPMDTIETSGEQVRDEVTVSEPPLDFETTTLPMDAAEPVAEVPPAPSEAAPPTESGPVAEPTREEPAPAAPAAPQDVGAFTLGKRDPKDKARRLARVLVSDMIMYNPQRHERALANGTLKEDFEDEIRKSWKEYVEQVGEQIARENDFWTDALNDVLAKGERVF